MLSAVTATHFRLGIAPKPRAHPATRFLGIEGKAAVFLVMSTSLIVCTISLRAIDTDPTGRVKAAARELSQPVEVDIGSIEQILLSNFDLSRTCYWIVGKPWLEADHHQRGQIVSAFRALLAQHHAAKMVDLARGEASYLPLVFDGLAGEAVVRIRVTLEYTAPIDIAFRMYFHDVWKIYDVEIEGASLIEMYRPWFRAAVRNGGMEGLLQRLRRQHHSYNDT